MIQDKKANEAQKKLFFALCEEAGYESEKLKERAKTKFNLEHFGDISSSQISELIDKIQQKVAFKNY